MHYRLFKCFCITAKTSCISRVHHCASSKLTCSASLDMLVLVCQLRLSCPLHLSFDSIKPLRCQTVKKRSRFE